MSDTHEAIYERLLLQTNHQIFTVDEIKQIMLKVYHIQSKIPLKKRYQENFKIYKTLCFQNNNGS